VTVNATDGTDSVSDVFTVTIASVNDAPTSLGMNERRVSEDATDVVIDISGAFMDVNGDNLTVDVIVEDNAIMTYTVDGSQIFVELVENSYGEVAITLIASDGELSAEQSFDFIVESVNDAPEFINSTPFFVTRNFSEARGLFEVIDVDGDSIIYSMGTANDSSLFTIDEITGVIRSLSPRGAVGSYTIEINAYDGSDFASTSLTVDVVKDTDGFEDDVQQIMAEISDIPVGETMFITGNIESNSTELVLSNQSLDVEGEVSLSDSSAELESASLSVEKIILSNTDLTMSTNSELSAEILESDEDVMIILDESSVVNVINIVNPGSMTSFQGGTVKTQLVTGDLIFTESSEIYPVDSSETLVVDGAVTIENSNLNIYALLDKASLEVATLNILSGKLNVRFPIELEINSEFNRLGIAADTSKIRTKVKTNFVSGDTYKILDSESVTGEFETLELPTLPSGLEWDITNLYTSGEISILSSVSDAEVGIANDKVLAYPNPFRISQHESFELGFKMNKDADVEVHVYNMLSQLVAMKAVTVEKDSYTKVEISKSDFSSIHAGVYVYFIIYNDKVIGKGKLGMLP
jgi:hypothetical protein